MHIDVPKSVVKILYWTSIFLIKLAVLKINASLKCSITIWNKHSNFASNFGRATLRYSQYHMITFYLDKNLGSSKYRFWWTPWKWSFLWWQTCLIKLMAKILNFNIEFNEWEAEKYRTKSSDSENNFDGLWDAAASA